MQNNQNLSPSFNSYSSDNLAEIANNIADELKLTNSNTFLQEEDEFEFSLELSSDQINNHGPVFPIFNRNYENEVYNNEADSTIKLPLKNLFLEENETSHLSSSSSSEDELETIPPGTYCIWRPKNDVESSPATCKKSKSTGSASKRFRIRDLIKRSNSEGKTSSLVFLTPKKDKIVDEKLRLDSGKSAGKMRTPASPTSSAHETFYMKNRAIKEGEKRKSYLPYRKDLLGFFVNVNGLAKPFPSF
ncbi:uncharacterized protein LOC141682850 [Apium graveolens]|uniref:uncharacterized protein LOC141682850 n=1 Tax=Apium graveolens TaxID=4045 RepID=UPI003D7B6B31